MIKSLSVIPSVYLNLLITIYENYTMVLVLEKPTPKINNWIHFNAVSHNTSTYEIIYSLILTILFNCDLIPIIYSQWSPIYFVRRQNEQKS